MEFSRNNAIMNQGDFEGEYRNRRNIYEIGNREDPRRNHIQNHDEEQIRARQGNMEYQTVVNNQSSNPQHTSNSANQNNVRRGGTIMALRRIFRGWRRGNSIRPQLQNETCCI